MIISAKTFLLNEVPFTSTGLGLGRIFWGPQFNPLYFPRAPWNLLLPFVHSQASATRSAAFSRLLRHLPQLFPTTARCHDEDEILYKARSLARHIPGRLDKSCFCCEMLKCLSGVSSRPSSCLLLCPSSATYIQAHLTPSPREEGSRKGNELKFRKLESELQV